MNDMIIGTVQMPNGPRRATQRTISGEVVVEFFSPLLGQYLVADPEIQSTFTAKEAK